jgi:ABC-type multidrug transport system fused ATPase/permease subunit
LGGVSLPDIPLSDLRQQVGIVTQEIQVFHASLRENLTLFEPSIPDRRIEEVIQEVGLWDWYRSLPDGLETLLTPGGGGLSAGQAQLLAFVRVFLKNPQSRSSGGDRFVAGVTGNLRRNAAPLG